MFIKRNYFLFYLLLSLSSMSLGLMAQNKPPSPEDKVLKVFLKTADRSIPQRLVTEWDLAGLKKLPKKNLHHPHPLVRDVLAKAQLKGTMLDAVALDDNKSKIPFSDVMNFDAILAHYINGAQLTAKNKGPLFIVYPYGS